MANRSYELALPCESCPSWKLVQPPQMPHNGLKYMKHRVGGCGGVICMDSKGNIGIAHTTERMAWACIDEKKSGCDGKNFIGERNWIGKKSPPT